MGGSFIHHSENGRRDRHNCLCRRDLGHRRRYHGAHHSYHALDSGDPGFCDREDLLSLEDHFPDHREIFSSFETMVFVVPTMVFAAPTMEFVIPTMVFAAPTMVFAFSTLVLSGGKMFSILDHPFSEAAPVLRITESPKSSPHTQSSVQIDLGCHSDTVDYLRRPDFGRRGERAEFVTQDHYVT
jgi:hypothetical protein